jgi:drug/metabolite transporter (DMT)-like permease
MTFLVAVWSLNYIVAKVGLRELPGLALGSFRLVTAGIASLAALLFVRAAPGAKAKEGLEAPTQKGRSGFSELWTVIYLGFFGVVLNQGCFTVGLNYTSVSHSSLIIGCAPILILLISRAMGLEAITMRKAIGMGLAFAGAATVGMDQGGNAGAGSARGDLLTLCAGIGLALYTVLGKRVVTEYGAMRTGMLSNIAAAVMALPVALWQIHALARAGRLGAIGLQGWGAVLYMGVLASAISYLLYFWALRYMTPARLGAVSYLQPIGAILLGLILLREPISERVAVGGVLVIAGVYAIQTRSGDVQTEEELA